MQRKVLNPVRGAALFLFAIGLTACGSSSSSLCDRAAECGYIGEDDADECTSDMERDVENGNLDEQVVIDCLECASENSCGDDINIDCGVTCAALIPYFALSGLH